MQTQGEGTFKAMLSYPTILENVGDKKTILHSIDCRMQFKVDIDVCYTEDGELNGVIVGHLLEDSYFAVLEIIEAFA